MKSPAFRTFLVFALSIGLCSYVMAGSRGDRRSSHGKSGSGGNRSISGPGFSSTNNPGLIGKTAKDEYPGFFNKENNPGIRGNAFGHETSLKARMRVEDARSFINNANTHKDPVLAVPAVANPKVDIVTTPPDPLPRALPSQNIFPAPKSLGPHPFAKVSPWPNPFSKFNPPNSRGQLFQPLPPLPTPFPSIPPQPPYRGPPSYPVPSPIPVPTPVDR